ncbi:coiled-coil domain-containing protein 86-like [Centruroides sculpturatus]|uniref:coiled-coil domain-containing protein 86-like n=1 Tax=Centruroides sculpturatus TaxID=218467 RepID=UPI000C6D4FC4|nr:coiled-coil domain-containing protein 86-like [Centruroides sculpturatus]
MFFFSFTSMKQVKSLKSSWKEKMQVRVERKNLLAYESELKAIKQKEIEEAKRKREEKRKRKEENQKKSEIVQVIRKTAKLKRMSKKQLRNIKKADTN